MIWFRRIFLNLKYVLQYYNDENKTFKKLSTLINLINECRCQSC